MPNLYLIYVNDEYTGHDTYDRAVVCANSEEEARRIHPDGDCFFVDDKWSETCDDYIYIYDDNCRWVHPNDVQVTFIGVAAKDMRPGTVICASYNEG